MSDEINWCGREDEVIALSKMVSEDASELLSHYEEVDLLANSFTISNEYNDVIVKIYRQQNEEIALFNRDKEADLIIESIFIKFWKYSFFTTLITSTLIIIFF